MAVLVNGHRISFLVFHGVLVFGFEMFKLHFVPFDASTSDIACFSVIVFPSGRQRVEENELSEF